MRRVNFAANIPKTSYDVLLPDFFSVIIINSDSSNVQFKVEGNVV